MRQHPIQMLIIRIFQYSGFVTSQITNSTLIFLIFNRAERLFGNYRHVMSTFAFFSLFFSFVEILTQPLCHVTVPSVIFFMDGPLKSFHTIGYFLPTLYCASFALCISMLASQFVYRYIAVCKPHLMDYFKGSQLFLLFVPCLALFIIWLFVIFYCFAQTQDKIDFFQNIIMETYHSDITKTSFVGAIYWKRNEDGSRQWQVYPMIGCVICTITLSSCFSTIVVCAYKTYHKMKDSQSFMSKKTQELNHQLFMTLVFQTMLPTILMYAPAGLTLGSPIFGFDIGAFSNLITATLSLYPSLEPIAAIFCISEFRKTIFCQKKKNGSFSSNNCSNINETLQTSKI